MSEQNIIPSALQLYPSLEANEVGAGFRLKKNFKANNLKKRARLISRSGKYIFQYFERHGLSSSGYV